MHQEPPVLRTKQQTTSRYRVGDSGPWYASQKQAYFEFARRALIERDDHVKPCPECNFSLCPACDRKVAMRRRLVARYARALAARDARRERAAPAAPAAKPTPETVLRAMLRAYEAAALDARIDEYRADDGIGEPEGERADALDIRISELRSEAAHLIAEAADEPYLTSPDLLADYEARLAGTRPLNAPPLEEPPAPVEAVLRDT